MDQEAQNPSLSRVIPTRIDYARALNTEQYAVVQGGDGYSLVLAGAGSGKTRTLVYRVAWLIEHGISPSQILLLTFTNKAAREMLHRVSHLIGAHAKGIVGGTYHHIANLFLRRYARELGYTPQFQILDQDDAEQLMRRIVRDTMPGTPTKAFPKPDALCRVISFAANSGQDLAHALEGSFPSFTRHADAVQTFAQHYHARKRAMNAMDFDDLLLQFLSLLTHHPDHHSAIASRFHYVLVDEYQDTNRIQAALTRHLSRVHGNLLVVGDDAQSIYSFRAADVGNILAFTEEYPAAKVFRLETNYRSQPHILTLANESIRHNALQYEKQLKGVQPMKELPRLISLPDAEGQARFIAERVLNHVVEGGAYQDIAILFRASHQTLELELELARRDIPFVKRGGLRYFEQAHIKDLLSYVRVVANPLDELAWRRLLTLYRGIGLQTADAVWQHIRAAPASFRAVLKQLAEGRGVARGREGLAEIHGDFEAVYADTPTSVLPTAASLINTILTRRYRAYARDTFDDAADRLADLETLAQFSARYDTLTQLLADAALGEGFKRQPRAFEGDAADLQSTERDFLILSTIHQAKGLEWNKVFLIGLVDGHFPHARALDRPHEMEEERRLFYVAVTRAKHELTLTYPETSLLTQGWLLGRPSLFVRELPPTVYQRVRVGTDPDQTETIIDLDEPPRESILDKILHSH